MIVETINLQPRDIQALDAGEIVIIPLTNRMMDVSIKKMTISEELDIEEGKKEPVFILDKEVNIDSKRGRKSNRRETGAGKKMGNP